ncbi:hypothetical protein C8A01DRAFT_50149 [Parachaetomium inaequale]|uniref:Calpain catalytic domain-containing protein n=1 Tax=Parachaetomium inaequale TaxID=2588326 RepID=A0AAN6P7K6_9PEZI|nr:hypothetical protein C8A01DRAFT_50149 [Parachaetomium inaequale]
MSESGDGSIMGDALIQSMLDQTQVPLQRKVDEFWRRFTARAPGKATTLLPRNDLAARLAKRAAAKDRAGGATKTTTTSYAEAAALCRAKVDQIVAECRRVNQKYRDAHFDLDFDLRSGSRDCLEALSNDRDDYRDAGRDRERGGGKDGEGDRDRDEERERERERDRSPSRWPGHQFRPKSVKRVGEIFDDPKFYIDGPTANDVRQGRDGDCWLMAALCTLSNKRGLIERVCVARNEDVGVYGFVFHRDGEWISEIIDDHLYLIKPDYDEARMGRRPNMERALWEDIERADSEEKYRKTYQSNSEALFFAQCENANETWLPLLEKAYAKAHGDYAAIEGGFTGEGIEDLTGGVTTELFTTDILDKEHFWRELMRVNEDFLFGCSTGMWDLGYGERKGIQEGHAYSVMRAVEIDGQRLVLLKNPWGRGEWTGAWSDGSKEWTPEWLTKLNHRFGDDGAFWISYKDLLRKYQSFDRTRLFGPEWKITSMWTTLNVSWAFEYHDTKFSFTLAKPGPVVIVLSQLDDRYFRGLQGEYVFGLGFRVHKAGEDDYLVRNRTTYAMTRSCNVELELEAGEYTVLIRIDAERVDGTLPAEDVVRLNAKKRREKLLRIGLAYDLAHSKARVVETAEEKAAREAYFKRMKDKRRALYRKGITAKLEKRQYYKRREWLSNRKDAAWQKELKRRRDGKREAKREAKRKAAEEEKRREEAALEQEIKAADEKKETGGEEKPPAEIKEDDKQVKAETPEVKAETPEVTAEDPERGTTSAEENTPAASTSETPAPEPAARPADAPAEPAQQPTPASLDDAPTGAQTPPELASRPGHEGDGPRPNAEFKEKILTALEVVSSFKKELEGMLGERPNHPGPDQTRNQNAPSDPDSDSDSDTASVICSVRSASTLSDTEIDYHIQQVDEERARGPPPPACGCPCAAAEPSEPPMDEFERDPWNAVAVVGLRVYYKVKEGDEGEEGLVKMRVVRANRWEVDEDIEGEGGEKGGEEKEEKEKGEEGEGDEAKVLDVDDSAKDATVKAA